MRPRRSRGLRRRAPGHSRDRGGEGLHRKGRGRSGAQAPVPKRRRSGARSFYPVARWGGGKGGWKGAFEAPSPPTHRPWATRGRGCAGHRPQPPAGEARAPAAPCAFTVVPAAAEGAGFLLPSRLSSSDLPEPRCEQGQEGQSGVRYRGWGWGHPSGVTGLSRRMPWLGWCALPAPAKRGRDVGEFSEGWGPFLTPSSCPLVVRWTPPAYRYTRAHTHTDTRARTHPYTRTLPRAHSH